jgi:hypothetical protein
MALFRRLILFLLLLVPARVRTRVAEIRVADDPGLVYVPVGPTSDFRGKISDSEDAQNSSSSSTLSPFGQTFSFLVSES